MAPIGNRAAAGACTVLRHSARPAGTGAAIAVASALAAAPLFGHKPFGWLRCAAAPAVILPEAVAAPCNRAPPPGFSTSDVLLR